MINLRNNPQEGIIEFTKYIFIIFSSGPVHCLTRCRGGNLNSVQTKVKPLNHQLLSWPLNGQGKAEQPPNISPRSFAFPVLIEERRSGTWSSLEPDCDVFAFPVSIEERGRRWRNVENSRMPTLPTGVHHK